MTEIDPRLRQYTDALLKRIDETLAIYNSAPGDQDYSGVYNKLRGLEECRDALYHFFPELKPTESSRTQESPLAQHTERLSKLIKNFPSLDCLKL